MNSLVQLVQRMDNHFEVDIPVIVEGIHLPGMEDNFLPVEDIREMGILLLPDYILLRSSYSIDLIVEGVDFLLDSMACSIESPEKKITLQLHMEI